MPGSIVIVGAGAMGALFGARLHEAGISTALLDIDRELVETINGRGVRVVENGVERAVQVPASTDPVALKSPTAVMFFVKSHQTSAAGELVKPIVGEETRIVSLQNGWGNADVLSRTFDVRRLVVGATYTSATVLQPGVVTTRGPGRTVLGPYVDDEAGDELVTPVAEALMAGGFEVERPIDVRTEIWKKLVLNAATLPTSALTGLNAGVLADSIEMRSLLDAAVAEAVEVGQAEGYELELGERIASVHASLANAGSGKASMLQDIEAGRRTEIDVVSGAVLRAAEAHQMSTPVTEALYALVTGLERARGLR